MTPRIKQLAVIGVVVIAAIIAWRLIGSGTQKGADTAHAAVPVTALKIAAGDVASFRNGIGTVQANQTVTVRSRVDGQLVMVAFHEGQDVKKGDLLARIDSRSFEAALHNAEATLAKDQAALANAKRD